MSLKLFQIILLVCFLSTSFEFLNWTNFTAAHYNEAGWILLVKLKRYLR